MREILFRGKRTDNGEWVYGYFVKMFGEYSIIPLEDENTVYPVVPETVGQYTGLTDKNGKKIFEGYIVKCRHEMHRFGNEEYKQPYRSYEFRVEEKCGLYGCSRNARYYRNYEVHYYKGRFRIKNKNITHYLSCDYIYNHEVEVIGNIYDNPELLSRG